jgi:DNA invertase Pin-like site-specific DNA recombinase
MAGKRAKKAAGGFIGGRPLYGYRIQGGELVADETEQEVVKLVRRLQRSGSSLRELADELDGRGYRPRTGRAWHPNTVRRIAQGD